MKRGRKTLSVLLVAGMVFTAAPAASWAESNVPDPGAVFPGEVNPQAKGKKLTGFLTIAYEFVEAPDPDCATIFINNMFVVTTLERRGNIKPFNRDFSKTGTEPFCFDNLQGQIDFVRGLLEEGVAFFFSPTATFEVKSVKEFLSSGTGAVSMELRLAVKPGPNEFDD